MIELEGGGSIDATVIGDGPPILLLRPLGGSCALWGAFRDRLATSLRTIAFDPRGVGRSSAPPRDTTTRAMARDAVSVLDAFGVGRAHVFGLSLGGMVATWLAIDAPERIDRLVLASTMPWGLSARHVSPRRGLAMARCFALPPGDCEACLARRVLSRRFVRERPDEVRRIERAIRAMPSRRSALARLLFAAARHDAKAFLPRIGAPTLVLAGTRDRIAAVESQRWLAARIPRGRFARIDAGHDLTLERPLETADQVLAFVRAQ